MISSTKNDKKNYAIDATSKERWIDREIRKALVNYRMIGIDFRLIDKNERFNFESNH